MGENVKRETIEHFATLPPVVDGYYVEITTGATPKGWKFIELHRWEEHDGRKLTGKPFRLYEDEARALCEALKDITA